MPAVVPKRQDCSDAMPAVVPRRQDWSTSESVPLPLGGTDVSPVN